MAIIRNNLNASSTRGEINYGPPKQKLLELQKKKKKDVTLYPSIRHDLQDILSARCKTVSIICVLKKKK